MVVLWMILLASCFMTSFSYHEEVCIAPDGSSIKSCKTIDQFCHNANHTTVVNVFNGTHSLNTPCEFMNITNLTMRGQKASTIKCSDSESAGFGFLNVHRLEISEIKFTGCGANWSIEQSTFKDGLKSNILSALLFVNGSDLILMNIAVSDAKSAGIYIYNVGGNVSIDSIKVANASSSSLDTLSGNVIVYDFLLADTNLKINNTQFINSGFTNIDHSNCTNKDATYSFSGGLALYLGTSKLKVHINSTSFSENIGCSGGNLAVLIFNHTSVTISHTNFTNGTSNLGGGMYVSFEDSFLKYSNYRAYRNSSKVLSIVHSKFIGNFAKTAGGGVNMVWKQSLILNRSYEVEVINSIFSRNSLSVIGSGGLGFHYKTFADSSEDLNQKPLFRVILNLTNCTFCHHYPNPSSTELQSESSVIVAADIPYLGINGINVNSNNCTGILGIASTLVFYNSTIIQNNSALTGAGIRLCSETTMYLTPHTNLTITNNSARGTGGGLQVNSNCLVSKPICFFQFTKKSLKRFLTVNLTINDNSADGGGENIYGGSINYCYFIHVKTANFYLYQERLHTPKNSISHQSLISSNPQQVCFNYSKDYQGKFECNRTQQNVTIYPGEKIIFPIRVVGQFFGSIPGTVIASITGGAVINDSEHVQTVDIYGQDISYAVYSSQTNISNDKHLIELKAGLHNDISVHEYSKRYLPAIISVQFKECPFGFINIKVDSSAKKYSCQCTSSSDYHCTIKNQTITKRAKSWLGEFTLGNQTYLAFSKYCPLDYCNNVLSISVNEHNLSQDEQCQYNRTGILCGSCPEGWSLVLGSSECREKCSNVWLLLILPFALAGLLLVAVIHFLNLTVTTGTVCGLIFYANIVQDYSVALLSTHPISGLTPILQVFLSWLNLDLGISTCFFDGLGAFGKAMLLFIFPAYIWVISATIIILSNRYIFFTRLLGENAVKVLATLFLLSYSKMLRVTLGAFNLKMVGVHVNTSVIVWKTRWILDGNISYFDLSHIAVLAIALVFIMLLLPFTMSLLCIRHVYSLSNYCRVFSRIDKLKPFFDTYTGPFKDKARFWTGLLLLARLLLHVINIVDYENDVIPYYIVVAVCLFLSAIMVYMHGVYNNKILNVLEYFFILNIIFIFLINSYKENAGSWKSISSHFLVSSAFVAFLGILVYHFYCKFSRLNLMNKFILWHGRAELDLFDGVRGFDSE